MEPYCPFLLPLLDGPTPTVDSPLEEEERIQALHGNSQHIWNQLGDRIPKVYGVAFIADWKGRTRRGKDTPQLNQHASSRSLFLEDPGGVCFLIEHPYAIDQFDRYGHEAVRVAVARPSLFARLWRESEANASPPEDPSAESPAVSEESLRRQIDRLLEKGVPSDWHLEPMRTGFRSRLRIDGKLVYRETLPREQGLWLQNALRTQAGIMESASRTADEGQLTLSGGPNPCTLRLSFVPALYGHAMVARFLFPNSPLLKEKEALGFDSVHWNEITKRFAEIEGIWLVVGPTCSGKTTTCHALLAESVRNGEKVLSAEDPVERVIDGVQQVSLEADRGLTYARVMRAFLRQAPDTILIGEIRDEETAAIATQAGRTGHRILSTLHARSDSGVLRRLQDLGQDPASIKPLLKLVLHQRLVPRLCGSCRKFEPLPEAWREQITKLGLCPPAAIASRGGCEGCHSGYAGRIALYSSGRFLENRPLETQFLRSAWPHICDGSLCLEDCPGPFTRSPEDCFQLCLP